MTGEQADYFGTVATRSILIVDSAYTRALLEIANHTKDTVPIVVPTLESIVLSDYLVCIVPNVSELSREEVRENKLTPVVFFGSQMERDELIKKSAEESLDDAIDSALRKYNLFDIADIEGRFEIINKAILEKVQLLSYLKRLPTEKRVDLLQKKYDPPRFRTFFEDVRKAHDEQEGGAFIVPEDPKKQIAAFDALLIQKMREWNYCHPAAKFKKELESETAELVLKYLKQREDGVRKDPLLGQSQHGEGSADRLSTSLQRIPYNPYGEFRWRVGRLIVDDISTVEGDKPNEHKEIAVQRYRDAERLKDSTFKTALIWRPLHLDNYGRKASFLVMQDIEGPTLDQVLGKLSDEIERTGDGKKNELLGRVRRELVDKYVDDVITWQNNEELKTFVKKPSGAKVIEEYKSRISDFQEIFEKLTPGLFSEEEGLAYLDALGCMDMIAASSQDIVRVSDASLKNSHLLFDRINYDREKQEFIFNIEDILRNTANPARGSIDREKIGKIFYHVDLHYRYGHVLEDLAHIITARETAFLIQGDDENHPKKSSALSKHATTEKYVNAITRDFLRGIHREDLIEDKLSLYLMFFYRSARKLKLYAGRYARIALEEYKRKEIKTKKEFDDRKEEFQNIILHHVRSCDTVLFMLNRYARNLDMNDGEWKKVDDWCKDSRNAYNDKLAVRYVQELNDLKDHNARLYAQISVLVATYRKLKSHFDQGNNLQFENEVKNDKTNGTS